MVHIIAILRSKKSFGVVPHSTMPVGMNLVLACEIDPVLQRLDDARLVEVGFGACRVHEQRVVLGGEALEEPVGKPEDGICTPHCVTFPPASRFVSFCA